MAFSVLETITFHLAAAQTSDRRAQAGLRGGAPSVEQPRGRPKPSDVFSGQPAGSSRRRASKRKRRSRNRRSRDREMILPVGDAPPSPPPTLHRSRTIRSNMADLAYRFVTRLGPTRNSRLPRRGTFELTSDSEPEDSRPQPQDGSPRRTTTIRTNMVDLANEFDAGPGPSRRSRLPLRHTFEFASDSESEDPRPQPKDESTTHNNGDNTIAIDDVAEPVADDPLEGGANHPTATPDRGRSLDHHHYPPANTVPVYMTGPRHPLGPGTSIISTSLRDEAARAHDARRAERHVQFCIAPPLVCPTTHEGPRGRTKSPEPEPKPVAPTTQDTTQVAITPQKPEPPQPNPFWPFTPLPTHTIDRASLLGVPNFFDRKVRFPDDFRHISYNRQAEVAGRLRPYGAAWGPIVREGGEMIGFIDQLWDGRAPLPPVLQRRFREREDTQSLGGSRSMALAIQPSTSQGRELQANAQSLDGSRPMAFAFQPSTLNNTDAGVAVDSAALPTAAQENFPRSILVSTSAGRSMRDGVNIRRPSVHFDDVDDYSPPPAENASHNDQAIEDEEEEELELSDSGDDDAGEDEEETTEEPEEDEAELAHEVPVAGSMAVPAPRFRPRPGSDGGENGRTCFLALDHSLLLGIESE